MFPGQNKWMLSSRTPGPTVVQSRHPVTDTGSILSSVGIWFRKIKEVFWGLQILLYMKGLAELQESMKLLNSNIKQMRDDGKDFISVVLKQKWSYFVGGSPSPPASWLLLIENTKFESRIFKPCSPHSPPLFTLAPTPRYQPKVWTVRNDNLI